jgi:4-amino-4-deoxy-L-arabinose transferase-like glycosyltransferase
VPYRDLFDHKGPLTYELFAGLSALLPDSLLAVRLALLAAFVVSIWQLAALAGRHAGPTAAWCTAVVYGMAGSSIVYEGPDPNTEQWALIGIVACVDLADRFRADGRLRWAIGAGAVVGLLVAMKSTHLVMAPVVAALLLQRRDGRAAGAAAATGAFLAAGALTLVPFALAGALGDLRFAVIDYNREYARGSLDGLLAAPWREQATYLLAFPGLPLLLAALALAAAAWRERDLRRIVALGLGWLLLAWVSARSTGRTYPHYFVPITPPLALLAGIGLAAVLRRAPQARVAVVAAVLCALAATLALEGWRASVAVPPDRRWLSTDNSPVASVDDAADYVHRITDADDRVYVVTGGATNGGQLLYWLADRRPADRLIFPSDMVPPRFDEVSVRLARDPPAALVVIPGAPLEPFMGAIERGGLEVVRRFPTGTGGEVVVWARPSAADRAAR